MASIAFPSVRRAPARPSFLRAVWPTAHEAGEHPTLVRSGLLLIYLYLCFIFLPSDMYGAARFVIHPLAAVWIGLALTKSKRSPKFAFPYVVLIVLQLWMIYTMILMQQEIPKPFLTGMYLWFPVELGMMYILAHTFTLIQPGTIKFIINFFLFLCALSAFVAILQIVHFGPAIRIATHYVYRSLVDWDNIPGVRASGLSDGPNQDILSLIVGMMLICYNSTLRRLRWWDWAMWTMFVVASFGAQHRSSMPLIALVFVVTLVIMLRKRPQVLGAVFCVSALAFVMAMTVFKHNFAYTFETQWSESTPQLAWRLREERQAVQLFQRYPITGIGPSPAPEALSLPSVGYNIKVENLYAAILLTLGIPGLILVLTSYASALGLGLAHALRTRLSLSARVMGLMGALGAFILLWNGLVMVNVTQMRTMFEYFLLLALVQSVISGEAVVRRRTKVSPYLQPDSEPKSLARPAATR